MNKVIVLLFFISFNAFGFRLSPMVAQFFPHKKEFNKAFTVYNDKDATVAIQISVTHRQMDKKGQEKHPQIEEGTFLIFPEQVILKPKERRVVRVLWKGEKNIAREKPFRLIVEELPIEKSSSEDDKRVSVKFLLKYLAAIYISPKDDGKDIRISKVMRTKNKKKIIFTVSNKSNTHRLLKKKHLVITQAGKEFKIDNKSDQAKPYFGENILAGAQRRFVIAAPTGLSAKKKIKVKFVDE